LIFIYNFDATGKERLGGKNEVNQNMPKIVDERIKCPLLNFVVGLLDCVKPHRKKSSSDFVRKMCFIEGMRTLKKGKAANGRDV